MWKPLTTADLTRVRVRVRVWFMVRVSRSQHMPLYADTDCVLYEFVWTLR